MKNKKSLKNLLKWLWLSQIKVHPLSVLLQELTLSKQMLGERQNQKSEIIIPENIKYKHVKELELKACIMH